MKSREGAEKTKKDTPYFGIGMLLSTLSCVQRMAVSTDIELHMRRVGAIINVMYETDHYASRSTTPCAHTKTQDAATVIDPGGS